MKSQKKLHLTAMLSLVLASDFGVLSALSAPVQKGGVQQNQTNSSFRLKRSDAQAPALNATTQSGPSIMSPDLTRQFSGGAAEDSFPTVQNLPLMPLAPKLPTSDNVARSNTTWRPGVILTGSTGQDALTPFCDLSRAAAQAQQYPTSPEAAFIHAVALTRTSQVDQALKEVKKARNLAQATGDPDYFNRAVGQYELTLEDEPSNNCIRYSLAWGYYMQAYLYAFKARNEVNRANMMAGQMPKKQSKTASGLLGGAAILASALTGTRPMESALPRIPGALDNVPSWSEPQIRIYYQKCLSQLNELLKRDPKDAWAAAYRAHVEEEYDGNHTVALTRLEQIKKANPQNSAASFFLAEAYARNGNFGAGLNSFGDALKMRAGVK
jgi:tetratricopeptide (TPR) repeat protein